MDAANWLEVIADVAAQWANEALAAGLAVERGEEQIGNLINWSRSIDQP